MELAPVVDDFDPFRDAGSGLDTVGQVCRWLNSVFRVAQNDSDIALSETDPGAAHRRVHTEFVAGPVQLIGGVLGATVGVNPNPG